MWTISVIPNKENVEPLSKILLPAVYIALINIYILYNQMSQNIRNYLDILLKISSKILRRTGVIKNKLLLGLL